MSEDLVDIHKLFLEIFHALKYEICRQKSFFDPEDFKNLVSNDLSSPVERTLYLAKNVSELFADRDRLIIDLCLTV